MRKGSLTLFALCTAAAALTSGCGGPARDGYVAVGAAAAGPERGAGELVPPKGAVELQPLPGPSAAGAAGSAPGGTASASTTPAAGPGETPGAPGSAAVGTSGSGGASGTSGSPGPGGAPVPPGASGGPGSPQTPGGTPSSGTPSTGGPGTPSRPPGTTPPATPAALLLSNPTRAAAAERWCERVTVTFANTGGTAARSGTVTFSTHIIGALGVDWATVTTTQPLPAPIAGLSAKTHVYTVCVEAWRVPLGMHVETRKVTATWS
ncbi:hypothetical protein [Streptomyces sp. NPDC090022]|uniref:hypothetical protein n=1 Tax=Streptomyces sp. NPDC090022 TaxID=3365920 RepID=UPI003804051E